MDYVFTLQKYSKTLGMFWSLLVLLGLFDIKVFFEFVT